MMMCRLLHSIPRGVRHQAQANATHHPWAGNGSQQRRRQEEGIRAGLGAVPLSNDAQASDKRSARSVDSSRSLNSLVRSTHWKWEDGWRSFAGKSQWGSFKDKGSSHTSHDALEWGTALMFSLHICRVLSAATLPDDSSGGKKKILESLANKLPGLWRRPIGAMNLLHDHPDRKKEQYPKVAEHQHKSPESVPLSPLSTAVAQLQAVTDQSVGQAHNSLGVRRAREGCLEQAASHFVEGSKVGNSRAMFNLAVCYEQGRGAVQDLLKAVDLYEEATARGHPQASYNLGVFHLVGKGGVQQDTARALELIGQAAVAGVTQANRYLGIHFLENAEHRDEKKAAVFLQKANEKQDTDAQYYLGLCFEHGWGVPMNSAKAASLYNRAAQKGNPQALYSLARFHEHGLGGLPCNQESALELYKQASEAGHQQASDYLEQLHNPTAATTESTETGNHIEHKADKMYKHSNNQEILPGKGHRHSAVNIKTLHVSVSAPSLQQDERKGMDVPVNEGTTQQLTYMNGKFSMSHLSLLLPFYVNLPSRPSMARLVPSGGQRSKVTFQVGDEEEAGEEKSGVYSSAGNGFHESTPWLTVS